MDRIILGFVVGFLSSGLVFEWGKVPPPPENEEDIVIQATEAYRHIMVFSSRSYQEAKQKAVALNRKGFPGEVYKNSNNFYAVTIGCFKSQRAAKVKENALKAINIDPNSKLVEGSYWGQRLFPGIEEKGFRHVQVASFKTLEGALIEAKRLRNLNYYSEVYSCSNGLYAVTAGHAPTKKAEGLKKRGLARKDFTSEPKLKPGEGYLEKVFPPSN